MNNFHIQMHNCHPSFCRGFCPEYRYNNSRKSLPRWTVGAPPTVMEKMMCFYPEASRTVHTAHDRPRDHNRIRNPSQIGEFCNWSIFSCNITNRDAEKSTNQTKCNYWSGDIPKCWSRVAHVHRANRDQPMGEIPHDVPPMTSKCNVVSHVWLESFSNWIMGTRS